MPALRAPIIGLPGSTSASTLNQKIDRVDTKLDVHRQETKDGFAGLHRVVGGLSHTLADHEERLKALEG